MTKLLTEIEAVLVDYKRRVESEDISPNTIKAVHNSFEHLKRFWGNKAPNEITKESWAQFQDDFESKYPGASQFNAKKYFVVLVGRLFEKGIIPKKIQIQDRFARRERNQRRKKKDWVFTQKEINALDDACKDIQERAQLRLGYLLAFRISDCAKLSWERIIVDEKYAYIKFSGSDDKASKIAKCPLPPSLLELLLQIPKVSKFCFPQARNADKHIMTQQINFKQLKIRAGVTRGSFHSLRHYRLTQDCMNPKLTLAQVAKMRRVSIQVLMEHYAHTRDEDIETMIQETR